MSPSPAARLAARLAHPAVWRGGDCAPEPASVPTGFAALDAVLPGGGWPGAGLTEMLVARDGIGEIALVLPALAALQRARRDVVWIAPPHRPYAPALAAAGIDLARVLVVKTRTREETLWAAEQALASRACGAVLAWPEVIRYPELRRLQLAAESGRACAFLFRPPEAARVSSPAVLRLGLEAREGGLAVHVLKRRGPALAQPVVLDAFAVPRRESPDALDRDPSAAPPGRAPHPRLVLA
jgi:cell division inhibitor SulA/protein ImuA